MQGIQTSSGYEFSEKYVKQTTEIIREILLTFKLSNADLPLIWRIFLQKSQIRDFNWNLLGHPV